MYQLTFVGPEKSGAIVFSRNTYVNGKIIIQVPSLWALLNALICLYIHFWVLNMKYNSRVFPLILLHIYTLYNFCGYINHSFFWFIFNRRKRKCSETYMDLICLTNNNTWKDVFILHEKFPFHLHNGSNTHLYM